VPILHAIVLGIVQGLTEFLPISSSGHLLLVPWLFGWDEFANDADLKRTFDVALHVGTFAGALAYFRRDVYQLVVREHRMAVLLVLASMPAAIVGVAVDSFVDEELSAEWLIGVMLIVFGLVLAAADRLAGRREAGEFGPRDALLMGVAQACALQPGVSRSGATISMGRWLGFERDAAARLSFLMSLPIIGGAAAYKGADLFVNEGGLPSELVVPFAWGIVASGITGFLAVWGLLRLLRTRSFAPFVVYRVLVGLLVVALSLSGGR
jgi:undecaprenyl-diphosphatase